MASSHIYRPPNSNEYFDASNTQRPVSPSTPGTPWARLKDSTNSIEQTPFQSPDPYVHSPGPLSSQKSFAETMRSRQSLTTNMEIQSLIQHRSRMTSTWGIHWWTPFCLISLFVLGVLGACVHHGFYLSLDGKEVKDQLWMVRVGTGMAFFTKMCLVGSVVLAYKQRIWYSMRRKSMTVGAIDGLFSIVEDPTRFIKWEMITGAKLATLMAVAIWTMPLAAVFSPATLTSEMGTFVENRTCGAVPSLDFTAEMDSNYRLTKLINGGYAISTFYVNTTDVNGKATGWFDYYDRYSDNLKRLKSISGYSGKPVERTDAALQACGTSSSNCTYEISFVGPGYLCTEQAKGVGSNTSYLASLGAPFNTSSLLPEGSNIYQAVVDLGDYLRPQANITNGENGQPIPPIPSDLGVFKHEPILWIGQSIDTGKALPKESPYINWTTEHIPKIFSCQLHETNYTFEFNFTSGQQNVTTTRREFLKPLLNTKLDTVTGDASPESQWMRPNTKPREYKKFCTYHATAQLFREWLGGTIEKTPTKGSRLATEASTTKLINSALSYPVIDLQWQVQSMYEDLLLSLLADPQLNIGTKASVPCTRLRRVSQFKYQQTGLWIPYAIVIAISFVFVMIGFQAMVDNGVSSDTVFSRIMTTTRNPTLDRLSVGACLGSDPFPKELERTKMRFGVLDGEHGGEEVWIGGARIEHCGFGTEDEIGPITKGKPYAGLRKWL